MVDFLRHGPGKPMMVLGDPKIGAPITADYDLLAVGHKKDKYGADDFAKTEFDEVKGVSTPAEEKSLEALQKATEIPTKDNPDPQRVVHHDPDSKEDERKLNEELESLRDRYDNGLPRTVLSVCPHCGRWISEIHLSIYLA
jgi:hypothetical protein